MTDNKHLHSVKHLCIPEVMGTGQGRAFLHPPLGQLLGEEAFFYQTAKSSSYEHIPESLRGTSLKHSSIVLTVLQPTVPRLTP